MLASAKESFGQGGVHSQLRETGWSSGDTTLLSPMGPDIKPSLSIFSSQQKVPSSGQDSDEQVCNISKPCG